VRGREFGEQGASVGLIEIESFLQMIEKVLAHG